MLLQTILHRVPRHKSFVSRTAVVRDTQAGTALEVSIEPRAQSRPVCAGCGRKGPGYDRLPPRRFAFVPW
jgi:hypothetical protein